MQLNVVYQNALSYIEIATIKAHKANTTDRLTAIANSWLLSLYLFCNSLPTQPVGIRDTNIIIMKFFGIGVIRYIKKIDQNTAPHINPAISISFFLFLTGIDLFLI